MGTTPGAVVNEVRLRKPSPERQPYGPRNPSTLEPNHRSRRAAIAAHGTPECVLPVDLGAAQPRLSSRSAHEW